MRRFSPIIAAVLLSLLSWLPAAAVAQPAMNALIVYDAPSGTEYDKLGLAYAIMLRNLLGHFDGTVEEIPVQNYVSGSAENYTTIFYIGASYDNPLPDSFLRDIYNTEKTVVWFRYNIWQLAWNTTFNFSGKYALEFAGIRGMNAPPTSANPAPGFFDTVRYKSRDFVKYYSYDSGTDTIHADPDLGEMHVVDPARATALVTITDAKTGASLPYILRANNFWYVADMPFTFIGPRDRYLVLADMLHDMLGINHAEDHPALVRLEDVDATIRVASMKSLTDYLYGSHIPFSIATIPRYTDPLGWYNDGVPLTIPMSQATNLKASLNYALARGGQVVQHGYTHQYDSTPNVTSAVSGDDFEFWDAVHDQPLPGDSTASAATRMNAGLAELNSNGYVPVAWETPHYQASPASMHAMPSVFPLTYQRAVYYTCDNPDLHAAVGKDFAVGQFFPYVIKRDYYGQKVIPENLGNFEYDLGSSSGTVYTWQDIYTNAQYAITVRDGAGSFFFHPFLLDPSLNLNALADFEHLVAAMSALGYRWTSPAALR